MKSDHWEGPVRKLSDFDPTQIKTDWFEHDRHMQRVAAVFWLIGMGGLFLALAPIIYPLFPKD